MSPRRECVNVMSNIRRLSRKEVLYRDEGSSRAGQRAVWRPEQKDISRMKEIVRNLSRPEDMVPYTRVATCSTAKEYMLLEQQRKIVRCSLASKVLNAAQADLVLRPVSQLLRLGSSIISSGEVKAASKTLKEESDALHGNKMATALEVPPGLDATEVTSGFNLHFISTIQQDYYLYQMGCHLPFRMYLVVLQSRLYLTRAKNLLARESSQLAVFIQSSTMGHENAKIGSSYVGTLETETRWSRTTDYRRTPI